MAKPAKERKRLEARIPAQVKELLERAASLEGRSLTDFIVESAGKRAREVIREHEVIEPSRADQIRLAETLLDPPKPNAKLKRAAARYLRDRAE